jgi:hypothetical protein
MELSPIRFENGKRRHEHNSFPSIFLHDVRLLRWHCNCNAQRIVLTGAMNT